MICQVAQKHNLTYGRCGKCTACRIDRQQEWSARMMLEAGSYSTNVFTTLTYETEPYDSSINKRDPTLFLKRLRKRLARKDERRIRYYLCGEYGDKNDRPHYHAILYNVSLFDTQAIQDSWQHGFTKTAELTPGRIKYTARYITKKIIKSGTQHHSDGRLNEFALMSRNPGLGNEQIRAMAYALSRIKDSTDTGLHGLVRLHGKKWPLDRYATNLLLAELLDLGVTPDRARTLVQNSSRIADDPDPHHAHNRKMQTQERFLRVLHGREQALRNGTNRL